MLPLRIPCRLFLVLAFMLGTMLPVPHAAVAHETTISAAAHMSSDCERCDDGTAVPVACAKVFCAGAAMILGQVPAGSPEAVTARFEPAPNLSGSGLARFPDTPPPRTVPLG